MTLKTPDPARASVSIKKVLDLMHQWQGDQSNYDSEAWPKLKWVLDEDRLSQRKLFKT